MGRTASRGLLTRGHTRKTSKFMGWSGVGSAEVGNRSFSRVPLVGGRGPSVWAIFLLPLSGPGQGTSNVPRRAEPLQQAALVFDASW